MSDCSCCQYESGSDSRLLPDEEIWRRMMADPEKRARVIALAERVRSGKLVHTPGSWEIRYEKDEARPWAVVAPDEFGDNGIVYVADCVPNPGQGDEEANARLIAAAPDLLGTLEWIASGKSSVPIAAIYREAARAAIDLARGEGEK